MPALTFDTSAYKRSHGTEPKGRGAWAFDLTDDSDGSTVETVFTPSMTLTEAKKWARDYVRKNYAAELATGYLSAQVCP